MLPRNKKSPLVDSKMVKDDVRYFLGEAFFAVTIDQGEVAIPRLVEVKVGTPTLNQQS